MVEAILFFYNQKNPAGRRTADDLIPKYGHARTGGVTGEKGIEDVLLDLAYFRERNTIEAGMGAAELLAAIKQDIDAGHPIIVTLRYRGKAGKHCVVVFGYEGDLVYVSDPAPGATRREDWKIALLVNGYRNQPACYASGYIRVGDPKPHVSSALSGVMPADVTSLVNSFL
ncbi:Hypothetical protein A7982_02641 [Minicystis rosea]|nr:Hypothetical protein A7982_02641 [Minicystis rosea]